MPQNDVDVRITTVKCLVYRAFWVHYGRSIEERDCACVFEREDYGVCMRYVLCWVMSRSENLCAYVGPPGQVAAIAGMFSPDIIICSLTCIFYRQEGWDEAG